MARPGTLNETASGVRGPAFSADDRAVYWGSVRLSAESCEGLLDIFQREGAAEAFNELYEAHMFAGGIPRCTGLRAA